MGVRTAKTGTKGRTKLGMALEQSAKEILAHVKGDVKLPTRRIVLPDEVDVERFRTKSRMQQAEFARAYLAVIAKNRGAAGFPRRRVNCLVAAVPRDARLPGRIRYRR